jgi:hypothetical protein
MRIERGEPVDWRRQQENHGLKPQSVALLVNVCQNIHQPRVQDCNLLARRALGSKLAALLSDFQKNHGHCCARQL